MHLALWNVSNLLASGLSDSSIWCHFVGFDTVKGAVDTLLNQFEAFAVKEDGILGSEVQARGFPTKMIWQPPEAWSTKHGVEYEHLKNMVIPAVPGTENSHPDMLLYELGRFSTVDGDITAKLEKFDQRDARYQ